ESLSHSHELDSVGFCLRSRFPPAVVNVVQVAANRAKMRKEGEQKGEKRLARFCQNLRLFSGLRRVRQDLAVGSGNSEPPIPEILSRFVFSGKVSSRLR